MSLGNNIDIESKEEELRDEAEKNESKTSEAIDYEALSND